MTSLDYNETTFFSNQSINNSNITSMSHIRSKSNEKTIDLVYKFNEDSKSLPKISNKINYYLNNLVNDVADLNEEPRDFYMKKIRKKKINLKGSKLPDKKSSLKFKLMNKNIFDENDNNNTNKNEFKSPKLNQRLKYRIISISPNKKKINIDNIYDNNSNIDNSNIDNSNFHNRQNSKEKTIFQFQPKILNDFEKSGKISIKELYSKKRLLNDLKEIDKKSLNNVKLLKITNKNEKKISKNFYNHFNTQFKKDKKLILNTDEFLKPDLKNNPFNFIKNKRLNKINKFYNNLDQIIMKINSLNSYQNMYEKMKELNENEFEKKKHFINKNYQEKNHKKFQKLINQSQNLKDNITKRINNFE